MNPDASTNSDDLDHEFKPIMLESMEWRHARKRLLGNALLVELPTEYGEFALDDEHPDRSG